VLLRTCTFVLLLRPRYGCEVWRSTCLYVCLTVCLSVRLHIWKTMMPNFTQFSAHVIRSRGSVLSWRQCAIRYVTYFRFCGWCYIFTPKNEWTRIRDGRACFFEFARWRHQSDIRQCYLVECARWRHRGRRLPSPTVSCFILRRRNVEMLSNEWWKTLKVTCKPCRTTVKTVMVMVLLNLLLRWNLYCRKIRWFYAWYIY